MFNKNARKSKIVTYVNSINLNKKASENLSFSILKQLAEYEPHKLIDFANNYYDGLDEKFLDLQYAEYLRVAGCNFAECTQYITDDEIKAKLIITAQKLVDMGEKIQKDLLGKVVKYPESIDLKDLSKALSSSSSLYTPLDLSNRIEPEKIFMNKKFFKLIDADVVSFEDLVKKKWTELGKHDKYFRDTLNYYLRDFNLKLEMTTEEIAEYKRDIERLQLDEEQQYEMLDSIIHVYFPYNNSGNGEYYIGNKFGKKIPRIKFNDYNNSFSVEYYFLGSFLSKSLCDYITKQIGLEGSFRYSIGIQAEFIITDVVFNDKLNVWEKSDNPTDRRDYHGYGHYVSTSRDIDLFRHQYAVSEDVNTGEILTTFECNLSDDNWIKPLYFVLHKELDEPKLLSEIDHNFELNSGLNEFLSEKKDEILRQCNIKLNERDNDNDYEIPF